MPLSTPPPSRYNGEMIQHGLQQLAEHNVSTPYPQEQYPHSTYTTPEPQYSQSEYNLGFQYDGYNPELQGTLYHDPEYQRGYTYPNTPATSPPTPQHTIRTRSGLQVRPSPVGRSKASPAPRPPKKSRKDKAKAESKVKLTAPLSEITANWDHIPIVDIEAYVNRSAEERRREIEEGKAPGKVKRPMNSFMLYRKAYQNRTKEYCLQTNHQIVSQVCGESWPMEPDHIRDQFTEWARIERDNHANAHPGYKFTPSKPPTLADRKRKHSEHPEDESDLEEYDPTYHGGRTIKKHRSNKSTPIHTPRQQTAVYTSGKPAYQYSRETSMEPIQGNYHRSHFFTSNPGRPYPAQYNQASLQHGQYYQQETVDHHNGQIQDVIMKKTGYVGLPGGQDFDLMHQAQTPYPQYQATPPPEHQIDPILMGQDQSLYDGNYGTPEPPFFGGSHDGNMNAIDPLLHFEGDRGLDLDIPDEHIHMLRGQQDGWEVNSLDISRDFDEKWFETK